MSRRLQRSALTVTGALLFSGTSSAVDPVLPVPDGWYAGDAHVHRNFACWGVSPPDEILAAMPLDLRFASVLIWCAGGRFVDDAETYFQGREDDPVSTPTQVVHYDLEVSACNMADLLGHGVYLYLEDIWFPPANTNGPIQDWARAQGAFVGVDHLQFFASDYDHFPPTWGCCRPYEAPVAMALGRVDYVSFQPDSVSTPWRFFYYTMLDCGFRPGLVESTDSHCLPNPIGSKRTYARILGEVTYGNWAEAVAAGRVSTAEDSNNFLHFTVDGVETGGQVEVAAGTPLSLQVTVSFPEGLLRTGIVEIVRNQEVVASRMYSQVGGEVVLTATDTPSRSAWYAARTARSHTGAVYAVIDGQPIRASVRSPEYYVDYMDWFTNLVESGFFPHLTPDDVVALLADVEQARSVYLNIKAEAEQASSAPVVSSPAQVKALPNPFRASTTISFPVDRASTALVEVFGPDGRSVRRLSGGATPAGTMHAEWDGRDSTGRVVASGVYLIRVTSGGTVLAEGKVVRLR
ncbi:MAG: CehA/McbA family metallohydrolase [bacterium]